MMEKVILAKFINFAADNSNSVSLELKSNVAKVSAENLLKEFFGEINGKLFNCNNIEYDANKNTFVFDGINFPKERYTNSVLDIDWKSIKTLSVLGGDVENILYLNRERMEKAAEMIA